MTQRDAPLSATMRDVAREAGVSRALVSIVMRDAPGASEETRARVKEIARRLGYMPDARAQALRAGRPRALGVVYEADQYFHASLLEGIYAGAEAAGYPVVLAAITGTRDAHAAIRSLMLNRCGAIVTFAPDLEEDNLVTLGQLVPTVVLAKEVPSGDLDCVRSDDADGLRQAVRHLVEEGHERIWMCASPKSGGNAERLAGFRAASQEFGIGAHTRVIESGATVEAGAAAAKFLLESDDPPTAVIGFNDACASGIQDVLTYAGCSIPASLSLVGFDDSPIAAVSYRQLTTVGQDIAALSRTAVEVAIGRMQGAPPSTTSHLLPTRLVKRNSVAGPRRLDKLR